MIRVRTAKPGDGAFLLQAARSLAKSHGYLANVRASAEDFERHLFCDYPIIGAILAEYDDAFAGAVVWHRSFSTFAGREIMYLEDLSVLPQFQRRGIAKALLRETARLAVSRDYGQIYWLMAGWNEAGRKLYQAAGATFEEGVNVCRLDTSALKALAA